MVALESELACPAAPWRRLPLAARPSPIPDLSTATLIEWARATAAHSAGALAALALAALLLLAFGLWRTLRCGLACVVPPRPPPRSAAARSILRGPGARSIKCLLGLCAAATLGGSIYGLVQVRTALVPEAQTVVNTAEATLRGALDAGHGLHEALAGLANATLALGTALQAGAPPGVPALEAAGQQLGLTSSRLSTGAATVDAVLEGLGSAVLGDAGVLHTARTQYLPLAQTGESLLQGAMYCVFALCATLCLVVAAGAAANWPAMVKPALLLLLLLTLIGWLAAAALTLLLRGGHDVCAALDPLLLRLAGSNPLFVYLLSGEGGSLLSVLSSTLGADSGLDVAAAAVTAGEALSGVEAALAPWPALQAEAAPAMEAAAAQLGSLIMQLSALEEAAGYPAFHPVLTAAESLVCCSLLNAAGGLWVGLVAACSASLAACLVACIWIGRIDRLGKHRCCHMHSVRDWSLEGQRQGSGHGGSSDGGPPSPRLQHSPAAKGSKAAGAAAASPPGSPRIQTWTEDLSGRGSIGSPRAPLSPAFKAAKTSESISAAEVVASLTAPRSLSLPARRPGAAAPYHYRPLQPVLEPCGEAGAGSPGAGLAGGGDDSHGQLAAEGSAPPLETSMEQLASAREAAAELSQHAFSLASRAQGLLSDAQRAAGSAGGSGPQRAASARHSPPAPRPLERQGSRSPRPYLNY